MIKIKKKILDFFSTGHSRTILAKKNIILSFFVKGVSVFIQFLLVPLTLDYLNPVKYGIWLTLSAIIGWLGIFDFGLGNGLRNKLTEALAIGDAKLARVYVSTTYAVLLALLGIIYFIFLFIYPFINWTSILNVSLELTEEITLIVLIVFTFFVIRFILKLIGVVFTAHQLPVYNDIFILCSNIIALVVIYLITKISFGSLLYISIAYSISPVIILIIATFYFFTFKFKDIRPGFKFVELKHIKTLAGLGIKFFVIQLGALIVFSTDNLIIAQLFGPAEVTPYNIAYKYFSIPILIFGIIITPFWSAFTDAKEKNDIIWIKRILKQLLRTWVIILFVVVFMVLIAKIVYGVWIGESVQIPFILSVLMGVNALVITWGTLFASFINGFGKIRLQMYYAIFAMLINIPVSIFFAKSLGLGISGIILGTCVSSLLSSVLGPIQVSKLINKKAYGIWNQ